MACKRHDAAKQAVFSSKFPFLGITSRVSKTSFVAPTDEEVMEDPRPRLFTAPPFSLPPGCRFCPSEEQLLCFYLHNKITATISTNSLHHAAAASGYGYNLIKELDPFDYDPFDLPDFACFSYGSRGMKKHWYYFALRVLKENRGRIRMKNGYWRRKGRVREVIDHRGIVLGMKRTLVFYFGNSIKGAVKTNWIMYEYALEDHLKASVVLHRVFASGRGNNISDNGLSCYGEGSVSAVCHIGSQHDGIQGTNIVDAKACEGDVLNATNDTTRHLIEHANKPNEEVITGPVSATTTLEAPPEAHHCEMMTTSSPATPTGSMSTHLLDNQQLLSLLEGDFMELDDLLDEFSPLRSGLKDT